MAHKAVGKKAMSLILLRVFGEKNRRKEEGRLNSFLHPIRRIMPPVMAMRDFRVLSSPPQFVHFIPMQAAPRPASVTIILTIIRARVAWRAPE